MNNNSAKFLTCSKCKKRCDIAMEKKPLFCPFCATPFPTEQTHTPSSDLIQNRYKILKTIGKGGMGEVLLTYDTSCEREIALKKIRADLVQYPQVYNRFLKEARITCQLTHPAIIPIYTIHEDGDTYYTMPYVEGDTLKQIIRNAKQQEKKGEKLSHIGTIPSLIRAFITVCQAVAYAHSKGVIHRDLKLENIIVGKYGEVLILDWGLAQFINGGSQDDELVNKSTIKSIKYKDITRIGKVVGTIAYMAPERARGNPATIQTDIYSLGVILYQILTLNPPFRRSKNLEEVKKNIDQEEYVDPILAAPYRDVPRILSRITEKCLAIDLSARYSSVDDLIHDVESYVEGRSDWFFMSQLDIKEKSDWEFQENVLIAEHMAITRTTEEAEWVSLMISATSYVGNTKIETEVCINENGHGIGFLLSIPEVGERTHINDGYCLWLGSDINRSTKLLRSNVEVMHAPDIFLKRNQWYRIRFEKIEQRIHLYIDDTLQLSYIAHIPLIGTHIGLLSRDADFAIRPLSVYVGSLNIMVNCLAVPDAFLAHRDFVKALSEYRRIAYSFPDRPEGREAIFRSGLTLIEQAQTNGKSDELLNQALEEFEKLHDTPGAPLEYLGKALVYQTLDDQEEEIKCFELVYRRYPKHPLLAVVQEQIISRMHEVARHHRIAAYNFILLATRHLPLPTIDTHTRRLFSSLQKHWEHLLFIEEETSKDKIVQNFHFAIELAFWLAKPYILGEILDELVVSTPLSTIEIGNAMYALIELGSWDYAKEKIEQIKENYEELRDLALWSTLETMIACHTIPLINVMKNLLTTQETTLGHQNWRCLCYCLNCALETNQTSLVHETAERLSRYELTYEQQLQINKFRIWAYLHEKNWQTAGDILYEYPLELLHKESTLLHFLYGCWLRATEGEEIAHIHFAGILNVPYPRSGTLASHFLLGHLTVNRPWLKNAFLWEKRQLYRQLALYYECSGNEEKKLEYQQLYQQQYIYAKF